MFNLKKFFCKEVYNIRQIQIKTRYFQELLLKESLEVIYQEHDINETSNNFMRIYLNIFEAIFPVIYHDKHKDNAWITRGIIISC